MSKRKIMLVDDEQDILRQMRWAFDDAFEVITAESGPEALTRARTERPELVTLDLGLFLHSSTDTEGLEVLKEILTLDKHLKVVVVTANTERDVAMRAIKMGAFDYYCKPVDLEELRVVIQRGLHIRRLEEENEALHTQLEDVYTFDNIIGSCSEMEKVFSMIRKVSHTDATVLIQGESGTGKELVAKAIHYHSLRRKGPFTTINCGAIPENLIESEFFGHEKGSFTGAHVQRRGKFELAHGGTLFLDEVGEIPVSLQAKLLRFLQDYKIERIGGRTSIELDVRILASTNKDLRQMMKEGTFREDLYFRIGVINMHLPPLRERDEDVVLLARSCLHKFAAEMNKKVKDFSREGLASLRRHAWPGNVRELENKVKRGVIVAQGSLVGPEDLGMEAEEEGVPSLALKEARQELDIRFIRSALKRTGGNISWAAKELGISRVSLHDLINKYSLR